MTEWTTRRGYQRLAALAAALLTASTVLVVTAPPAQAASVLLDQGTGTVVTEGGVGDSYTIVLDTLPIADVVVTITGDADATVGGVPLEITFTVSDWSVPQPVPVTAVDDDVDETSPESATVTHSIFSTDPQYSGLPDFNATVSVVDNDSAGVSVVESGGSTAVTEGGATDSYTVVLTSQPTGSVTVTVSESSADFSVSDTSLTFTTVNWDQVQTVTVTAVNDSLDEPSPEVASITHSASGGGYNSVTITSVSVSVTDNDPRTSITIADGSAAEDAGSMNLSVTLSAPSAFTVSVPYSTANGSAVAGSDYTAEAGTVTFTPGDVEETVTISLTSDSADEDDETFSVTLGSGSNGTVIDPAAIGTINDDDPPPALSIDDVQREEGVDMTFTVSLSAASGKTVTVNYATADGAAAAPADYTAAAATLTFTPGQVDRTVTISTVDDAVNEAAETFTVVLSGPGNATVGTGTGTGTLLDNDGPPGLSVLDAATVLEPGGPLLFTIALLPASGQSVTVQYTTANGTATAGQDYTVTTGQAVFAPGQTMVQVPVPVVNDGQDEIAETVLMNLSNSANAGIVVGADQAMGTITDDDNVAPDISATITDSNGVPSLEFGVGEVATVKGSFTDPGAADTHSVTVVWGDGSPSTMATLSPVGARTFQFNHGYGSVGIFQISVTVADADGGSDAVSTPVSVADTGTTGATSVGLVDPSQGRWHLYDTDGLGLNALGDEIATFFYGNPGDFPIMGDWDCDGIDTPGMYRQSDGFVYLRNSSTVGVADIKFFFGNPGDVPIVGDFNGDRCDTVSIYRPSLARFFIINELGENNGGLGAADFFYTFGNPGDKPFIGDFDGDGIDTAGLHRESTGFVYFRNTHNAGIADAQFFFGDPGDRVVAGDWGIVDAVDSPAIYRPGDATFYFRYTNTQGNADAQLSVGSGAWLPIAGVFGG